MDEWKDYVKNVVAWKNQLQEFLETEQVDRDEGIWSRLSAFTNMVERMEGHNQISPEELICLQSQVDELHQETERYFAERHDVQRNELRERSVAIGKHQLPPLPYPYNALEPYISEEIMRLHHDKHHRSYVEGLNKAELALKKARETGNFSLVQYWSRELAFHGSGHYLHTIFWNNMSPNGGGKPKGKLLREIEKYFGSYEAFKKQFTEAAKQVEGVGWALLVWSPRSRHLEILQSELHMNLTQWDTIPLLVLDVWEHAYYLQYKNRRPEYVENWWNIVNWDDVEKRFEEAEKLKWKPY